VSLDISLSEISSNGIYASKNRTEGGNTFLEIYILKFIMKNFFKCHIGGLVGADLACNRPYFASVGLTKSIKDECCQYFALFGILR